VLRIMIVSSSVDTAPHNNDAEMLNDGEESENSANTI
jgi:hypothetical protein